MGALEDIFNELLTERALNETLMRGEACPAPPGTPAPMKPWHEVWQTWVGGPAGWVSRDQLDVSVFTADFESHYDPFNQQRVETPHMRDQQGEFIRRMLYPSGFYNIGKHALMVLAQQKPPATASFDARVGWLLEACWWINGMLLAANIYPKLIPEAVAKALDRNYFPGAAVDNAAFLQTPTFAASRARNVWPVVTPFRVPQAGDYGTAAVMPSVMSVSTRNAAEWQRGRRWMHQYPWWKRASGVTIPPGLSPREMRLNEMLGSFTGVRNTFAQEVDYARTHWNTAAGYAVAFETYVPDWIGAMLGINYWDLVRSGVDIWRHHYQQKLVTVQDEPVGVEYQGDFYVPNTEAAVALAKQTWEQSEAQARGMLFLAATFTTWMGLAQLAAGQINEAQWGAVVKWYELATFKYQAQQPWTVSIQVPPQFARAITQLPPRVVEANLDCQNAFGCPVEQQSSLLPWVFDQGAGGAASMMTLLVNFGNGLRTMEELAGVWLGTLEGYSPQIMQNEVAQDPIAQLYALASSLQIPVADAPRTPAPAGGGFPWIAGVAALAAGAAGWWVLRKRQ